MGSLADEDFRSLPLPVLFSQCSSAFENLSSTLSSKNKDILSSLEKRLAGFELAVESRNLFSANEEQDDVATGDLKFLLAPFYRAELLSQVAISDPEERLAAVQVAMRLYDKYLARAHQYDLLGAVGKNLRQALLESQGKPLDPNTKRVLKIEKFKRDKAITLQLKVLREKTAASRRDEDDEEGSEDEELERQLWVLQLEAASLKAQEQIAALETEMEVLRHMVRQKEAERLSGTSDKEAERKREEEAAAEAVARAAMAEKLRGIADSLQQHGRARQQIREEVFRAGHTAPTMTLRELADQEVAEAQERDERQARTEKREQERRDAMSDDELDAEDKKKQRDWDDWRDWHPKGAGNSKLKPCG